MNFSKILSLLSFLVVAPLDAQKLELSKAYNGMFYAKGIPYAKPPVNNLRWASPVDENFEEDTTELDNYGFDCLAKTGALGGTSDPDEMNEDCLFLNIWTPSTVKKYPVMFWIHGGGFTKGHGRLDGEVLAKYGVVVVSLNYRLGPLGFFALPQNESDDPNYGLLDIISALRWVKKYISLFGGDPENITIFGNSAGGLAADLLINHPKAKNLFHRAIAQSSYLTGELSYMKKFSSDAPKRINGNNAYVAELEASKLLQRLGLEGTESLMQLRSIDANKIVKAQLRGLAPIVDGESVKLDSRACIISSGCSVNLKSYMTGGTSWEGDFAQHIDNFLADNNVVLEKYNEDLAEVYPSDFALEEKTALARFLGDQYFLLSAKKNASAHAKTNAIVYTYYLNFQVSRLEKYALGTPHGWDTGAIWWSPFSTDSLMIKAGAQLRAEWVRFAYGYPLEEDGSWSPWNEGQEYWQNFGDGDRDATSSIATRLRFSENFYEKRKNSYFDGAKIIQ